MKRITKLLQTDSHINWQDLRWSFYTRYSIPTVLGTPSSMTIQSTMLTSLRGNITKTNEANTIHRNHQIDIRYVCVQFRNRKQILQLEFIFYVHYLKAFVVCGRNEQKLQSIFEFGAFNQS